MVGTARQTKVWPILVNHQQAGVIVLVQFIQLDLTYPFCCDKLAHNFLPVGNKDMILKAY